MRRLRFFRILLLALLVPFVVVLVMMLRNPPEVLSNVGGTTMGPRVLEIEFVEFADGEPSLYLRAGSGVQEADGRYRIEDVQRLEVSRDDASPLVIKAGWGILEGPAGQRLGRLEGGVNVEDQDEEISLSVPIVELNQVVGEARSLGLVTLDSPLYEGKAAAVVYGLNGQPTILESPEIEARDGSTFRAKMARLLDGMKDVELTGAIRATQGESRLRAGRGRIRRDERGQVRHLELFEAVEGLWLPTDSPFSSFEADHLEARLDESGEAEYLLLEGDGYLQHGTSSLRAERIETRRQEAGVQVVEPAAEAPAPTVPEIWELHATGEVRASVLMNTGPSILISDEFRAEIDGEGNPLRGEALGDVSFRADEVTAEAQRATFDAADIAEQIVLYASTRHRARLARDRSRVAAERIATNAQGTRLEADGRVESSLLSNDGADKRGGTGLFRQDEAVHFVSDHLEGDPSDNSLVFTGGVRGWQGERNLAADRVEVDQDGDRLDAVGNVTTRLPRAETGAVASGDFIQVSSERLRYRGSQNEASFDGEVRVVVAEGWLESNSLDVDLTDEDREIREILAGGNVRFEFESATEGEGAPPVSGEGDRVLWMPKELTVTLFGDRAPAAVRRLDIEGGVTRGRVLRYHLDTGELEVESGDQDRATIKTSEP